MERDKPQEQPNQSVEGTSTETPVTPQTSQVQESPSTDTTGRLLYLQTLGDKNREIERLSRELAEKNKPVEQPITPQQEQKFFESPMTSTRDLIRSELDQALAPIMDVVRGFRNESAYDKVKNQIKQNPALAPILARNEKYVDQMMQNIEPTETNIAAAIFQAEGLRAAGFVQDSTAAPNTQPIIQPTNTPAAGNQQPVNPMIPAHLRPSAPPAPVDKQKPYVKPLDENERLLMRMWGMTEQEFREGQVRNEDNVGAMVIEPETTASMKAKSTNKDQVKV